MTERQPPRLEPATLLQAFIDRGVEFVAVGGFAALMHGAQRATKDIDLCVAWSIENLERVAAALRDLDARLRIGGYVSVPIDVALLRRLEVGTWRTKSGDVDVLLGIPRNARWELVHYEELRERGQMIELGQVRFVVAALDDIIRSKELADRPADREALPELRRLARERDEKPNKG